MKKEANFVMKAAYCEFNRIWYCQHPKKKGKKCTKICKYYNNIKENKKNNHKKEKINSEVKM
jgi:hypothetical protein